MSPLSSWAPDRVAIGERVSILRSSGGFSNAEIIWVAPDRVDVRFVEGGNVYTKEVLKNELHRPLKLSEGHLRLNQRVGIGQRGSLENGVVSHLDPAGWATVTLENGQKRTVRIGGLSESEWKAPSIKPKYHEWGSRKIQNYVARSGSTVEVNLQSQPLQKAIHQAIAMIYETTGVAPWSYAALRDQIIRKGGDRAAVCRELSMTAHLVFSEFGIRSKVITGSLTEGGHAWVQDSYGRIIDSNYTRSVESFKDYKAKTGATVLKETEIVSPISVVLFDAPIFKWRFSSDFQIPNLV